MGKRLGGVLALASGLSAALPTGTALALPHEPVPAVAQSQQGKYRGSSSTWVPDYAGTIQIRSSGVHSYTAIADVELKRKPTNLYDPNPTAFQYEMRGAITLTTPFVISRAGRLVATCTAAGPTPVSIADSGLSLYTNDRNMPNNSYEFIVSQFIRLPHCVDARGRPFQQTMQIHFNTSQRASAASDPARPPLTLSPKEQAEIDRVSQAAQSIMANPRLQQELAAMVAQDEAAFRRTGKRPSAEEIVARMERLQRQGILPSGDSVPSLSPDLQRKLDGAAPSDHSDLRRFTSIDRLRDAMSVNLGPNVVNVSWDLRRVNGR